MGVGLLFAHLGFGKQMREVVEHLALAPMELARMNLMFGRDVGDRIFFLEHFQHHLSLEGGGMMFLPCHNVPSVTPETPNSD